MWYEVTVGCDRESGDAQAPVVRSVVEAGDKDTAFDLVVGQYRRAYPGAGRLTIQVVRLRSRG